MFERKCISYTKEYELLTGEGLIYDLYTNKILGISQLLGQNITVCIVVGGLLCYLSI